MTVDRFVDDRRPSWDELRALVDAARKRPERLGPEGLLRLGTLYRQAAADLAVTRRKYPLDPVAAPLEELVAQARHLVYASVAKRERLRDFYARRFWQRVLERPGVLLVSIGLLLLPAVVAFVWARANPGQAGGFVPGSLEAVSRPRPNGAGLGLSSGASAALSTQIFTNNIKVAFLALAGGMTAGIVTVVSLVFNGVMFGVVCGLASGAGTSGTLTQLIAPHGVLELSVIAVAGTAGLRIADAMLAPGLRRRSDALVGEARAAAELALGTMPWFVLAGLVEGFVTPAGIGVAPALLVGFGLGGLFWGLALWRGRARAAAGDGDAADVELQPGAGLELQVGAHAGGGEPVGVGLHDGGAGAL
jgi:uncharacterized membrane protein SpoIIM required for sporulation